MTMPGSPVLAAVFSCRSLTRACSKPFVLDFQACGPSSIITRMPRTAQRWFRRPARMSASTGPSARPSAAEGMIWQAMGCEPWLEGAGFGAVEHNDAQIGPAAVSEID